MVTETREAPPVGATDVQVDGASRETGSEGTATEDVTVRAGETGEHAEATTETTEGEHPASGEDTEEPELKHSDATLTAAREAIAEETRKTVTKEHLDAVKAQNTRYTTALKERAADRATAIRSVADVINGSSLFDGDGNRITADDLEKGLGVVGDVYDAVKNAALALVAGDYMAAFSDVLGADADAFWKEQADIDPNLHAGKVAKAVAERIALTSDAVKNATPEQLIAANKPLKEHVSAHGDDRYNAGRKQGRKDPVGERSSENAATPIAEPSYAQLQRMNRAQLDALAPGVFDKVMAGPRS